MNIMMDEIDIYIGMIMQILKKIPLHLVVIIPGIQSYPGHCHLI